MPQWNNSTDSNELDQIANMIKEWIWDQTAARPHACRHQANRGKGIMHHEHVTDHRISTTQMNSTILWSVYNMMKQCSEESQVKAAEVQENSRNQNSRWKYTLIWTSQTSKPWDARNEIIRIWKSQNQSQSFKHHQVAEVNQLTNSIRKYTTQI